MVLPLVCFFVGLVLVATVIALAMALSDANLELKAVQTVRASRYAPTPEPLPGLTRRMEALLWKNVIVHTRMEHSIEGVLYGVYADSVVIRHARYLMNERDVEELQGDQVIPRVNIEWIQELAANVAGAQNE